jgi:hypothetical protein
MPNQNVAHEIEELRQLACRIFTEVSNGAQPPDSTDWSTEGIYWDVASVHARHWPADRAAELLATWRAELDGEAA